MAEDLDETEDVVPAPAVESGRVVAEFVQDFVHLEGAPNRLDQNRGPDGPLGYTEVILGKHEDVVPKTRFQVTLQFRKVAIRCGALGDQRLGVVEEVKAKIEQRTRNRLSVPSDVLLHQMPAARPYQQDRGLGSQRVFLAFRAGERDGPANRVAEIDLPLDVVRPRR